MTPKEKAYELVMYKFIDWTPAEEEFEVPHAKECALILVDEIIGLIITTTNQSTLLKDFQKDYWQEVKEEIKKL